MRKIIVFGLGAGLLGGAAYSLPDSPLIDALQREQVAGVLGRAPAPVTAPPATTQARPAETRTAEARVFSPSQPLFSSTPNAATGATTTPGNPVTDRASARAAPAPDPQARRLTSSRPADEDARQELVKDLQRELKRVGCYDGEINGTWAPQTRKSMSAFTDRVNATLPLDEPDYILLTLVQGHRTMACGQVCPTGQEFGAGKCVPRAILAQNARRSTDKSAAERLDADVTEAKAPVASRKRADNGRPAERNSWSTIVTASPPPAPSSAPEPPPAAAPTAPAPLPGRMAVGARVPAEAAEADIAKIEAARRKAELSAAANRATEAQASRTETPAPRTTTEVTEAKSGRAAVDAPRRITPPAAPAKSPAVAALSPVPSSTARSRLDTDDDNGQPETSAPRRSQKATSPAPAPRQTQAPRPAVAIKPPAPRVVVQVQQPQPSPVYRAQPQRVPPPYAVGVVVSAAPRPSYTPSPQRWTRTVFDPTGGR